MNCVHYDDDVLDCGEICVSSIEHNERQSIMAKLNAKPPDVKKRVTLTVKADTGANGNVLPSRCLKQMYPDENIRVAKLKKSNAILTAVNGTKLVHSGTVDTI